MKRTVQVTSGQLDRLIADIRALPSEPVGEHLMDDEFIDYTMEALAPPEFARLDTHLASCPECAAEMERLMEASEVWRGAQGGQRLARLRERALATVQAVPAVPSPTRKVPWTGLQAVLEKISSVFIGWQVPVASVAGILVGIALTLLMPRLMEQDGMQAPIPTEQSRGDMKGGHETGECELTVDRTELPAAEEWLKRIAEDVVRGRVDEAVDQLEVFRCYYPDYKQSPSSVSPQPETK